MKKQKKLSYLFVGLAIFLRGSITAVGKLVLQDMDHFQILFLTSVVAMFSLFFIALFQWKLPIIKQYKLKDYLCFAGIGFLGVFLSLVLEYGGLMLAPAQEAGVIIGTRPIWVVVFSIIILREKFSFRKIFAILLGFVGIYVVMSQWHLLDFSFWHLKGNMLSMVGAMVYGLFSVLGKKLNYDQITSIMFYFAFSLIFTIPTMILFSSIPSLTLQWTLGVLRLGIFSTGLGYFFWFLALKHGDTAKMSNLIFLGWFLSLVFIYFLLGEKILLSSIIGLIIILAGIVLQSVNFNKKNIPSDDNLRKIHRER